MIFEAFKQIWKFISFKYENPPGLNMLCTPGGVTLDLSPVTDSGTRGPTCHTLDRGELTGGENSPTVRSPA
jgi:hypothetical protein